MPQTLTIIAIAVLAALAMGVALYIRRVGIVKDESQNGIRNLAECAILRKYIDNFVITGGTMPVQPTLQGEWRAVVGGKSVSLFGLAPGKMLFVYDLQGRLLRRERTEPMMLMDFMDAGKFLIRYGNETRAVTIR